MSDFQKDIEKIKNPQNIREALFASGPTTLMRALEKDPTASPAHQCLLAIARRVTIVHFV